MELLAPSCGQAWSTGAAMMKQRCKKAGMQNQLYNARKLAGCAGEI
jgi:hypothetical protein